MSIIVKSVLDKRKKEKEMNKEAIEVIRNCKRTKVQDQMIAVDGEGCCAMGALLLEVQPLIANHPLDYTLQNTYLYDVREKYNMTLQDIKFIESLNDNYDLTFPQIADVLQGMSDKGLSSRSITMAETHKLIKSVTQPK